MLYELALSRLDANKRKELAARGVQRSRVSEWIGGLRLPTRAQALVLADVAGVNWIELEAELSLMEAERELSPALRAGLAEKLAARALIVM